MNRATFRAVVTPGLHIILEKAAKDLADKLLKDDAWTDMMMEMVEKNKFVKEDWFRLSLYIEEIPEEDRERREDGLAEQLPPIHIEAGESRDVSSLDGNRSVSKYDGEECLPHEDV